jgi:hypothetical protein
MGNTICSDTTNCVSQHIFDPFFSFRALSCRLRGNWLTGSTGKEKDHRKLQNLISKLLWNLCTDEMHFLERKTSAILQRSWKSGSSTGSFSLTKNSSKHKPYKLSLANDVLMQVKLEEVPDPALQKSRPRWIRARTTGRLALLGLTHLEANLSPTLKLTGSVECQERRVTHYRHRRVVDDQWELSLQSLLMTTKRECKEGGND